MRETLEEFLGSVWEKKRAVSRCIWEIRDLQDRCRRITACLDGAGRGSGDSRRDGALVALADRQSRLPVLEEELTCREEQVRDFLDRLEDERLAAILRLRYVCGLKWSAVQSRLQEMNLYYSERQVYNLHRKALAQARLLWAEEDDRAA